jgi:hypothetical protein
MSRRLSLMLSFVSLILLSTALTQAQQTTPSPQPPATDPGPTPTIHAPEATLIATLDPELLDTIEVEPVVITDMAAPIHIELPEGWLLGHAALPLQSSEEGAIAIIPFSVYAGPVTGGTGYIIVLWAFPNIAPVAPVMQGTPQINLWADGLRLLYLAVMEEGCEIGRDTERPFPVGDYEAMGAYFAAVNCPELPDTQGWFAGLQEEGLNFMFYAYVEPRGAIEGPARRELQAILNTVEVDLELLPEQQGTVVPDVNPSATPAN